MRCLARFDLILQEEKIQQDNEREVRARRRNKARKAALASKAAEQNPSFTPTTNAWNPAENLVHGPVVACPQRAPFRVIRNSERSALSVCGAVRLAIDRFR